MATVVITVIGAVAGFIFGFALCTLLAAKSYGKGYKDGMAKGRRIMEQKLNEYLESKTKENAGKETQTVRRAYE